MKKLQFHIRFSLRFFLAVTLLALLLVLAWIIPSLYPVVKTFVLCFWALVFADILLLFSHKTPVEGNREVAEKLSNGDENKVRIHVQNHYPFTVDTEIIDEVPVQFQWRNFSMPLNMAAGKEYCVDYSLIPRQRGVYAFGTVIAVMQSPLGFVKRVFRFGEPMQCKVYPGFLRMRQFELLAATDRLSEAGVKSVRRLGHQLEFDQIREYVTGDDSRTVNWKATALKAKLMVNQYQDEKAQPLYSIIDMGRPMKMPFGGMQLLDHSINASLVISNIALNRQDKAGLLTFNRNVSSFLQAERGRRNLMKIMELLYNQETSFVESDYELLYAFVRRNIRQRSLLILYTNFESRVSMERIRPYLLSISRAHPLLVVFFENAEVARLLELKSENTEEIYMKTIAEQLLEEKRQIVKELNRYGIYALLTAPEKLTVNLINRYLEFKAAGVI